MPGAGDAERGRAPRGRLTRHGQALVSLGPVRIFEDQREELDLMRDRHGRTQAEMVREALDLLLEKYRREGEGAHE